MKKLFLLLIALGAISISGCGVYFSGDTAKQDDKDKKIAELEQKLKDDTFQKNQECAKYKDEVQKNIDKRNKDGTWKDGERSQQHIEEILEIIYSKKYNSCFIITKTGFFGGIEKKWHTTISVLNILTNTSEDIYEEESYPPRIERYNDILKDKIKELKGE